ncbi:UNVERIFIED_CONTAM: hypothetical protein GTU68_018073 [Idotea baltica]|nr:hypothetical protein [Idotea baltica]
MRYLGLLLVVVALEVQEKVHHLQHR